MDVSRVRFLGAGTALAASGKRYMTPFFLHYACCDEAASPALTKILRVHGVTIYRLAAAKAASTP